MVYCSCRTKEKGCRGMYSPGLKKLGAEFGLTAGKGRVYGLLEGFPVSMWDGAGTKNMLIYLGEPRDAAEDAQTSGEKRRTPGTNS